MEGDRSCELFANRVAKEISVHGSSASHQTTKQA